MYRNRISLGLVAVLLGALGLAGCGGGDHVASNSARITLYWSARSPVAPAVVAPSSALSLTLTLKGGAPAGGDYTCTFDRHSDPAGAAGLTVIVTLYATWADWI